MLQRKTFLAVPVFEDVEHFVQSHQRKMALDQRLYDFSNLLSICFVHLVQAWFTSNVKVSKSNILA